MSDPHHRREWTIALCVGMLLLPFVWPFRHVFASVLFLTAIAFTGWIHSLWKSFGPKGRYDLASLKTIDEREKARTMIEEAPDALAGQVLCLCCQEEFDAKYPVCPHCGRSVG